MSLFSSSVSFALVGGLLLSVPAPVTGTVPPEGAHTAPVSLSEASSPPGGVPVASSALKVLTSDPEAPGVVDEDLSSDKNSMGSDGAILSDEGAPVTKDGDSAGAASEDDTAGPGSTLVPGVGVPDSVEAPQPLKDFTAPSFRFFSDPVVGAEAYVMDGAGWSPKPSMVRHVWKIDGQVVKDGIGSPAARMEMKPEWGGKRLRVEVAATLYGYNPGTALLETTVKLKPLSAVSGKGPKLYGRAAVGQTLTTENGSWSDSVPVAGFKYQWLRDGKAIAGGTKKSYKLVAADAGKKVNVRVYPNKVGSVNASALSNTVTVGKPFTKTPKITISGSVEAGQTLKVSGVAFTPAATKVTYQWYRSGSPIKGATKSTYKTGKADGGHNVRVHVTGSRSGYESFTVVSPDRKILHYIAGSLSTPSGELFTGRTLTARSTFSKGYTMKYQWLRNGAAIKGATKSTYKLTTADRSKKISVRAVVSYSNSATRTVTSPSVTGPTAWLDQARAQLDGMPGGRSTRIEYSNHCSDQWPGIEACSSPGVIYLTKYYPGSRHNKGWMLAHEHAHQYQFTYWNQLQRSGRFKQLFGGNVESLANAMATTRGYRAGSWSYAQLDYARGVYSGRV